MKFGLFGYGLMLCTSFFILSEYLLLMCRKNRSLIGVNVA